MIEKDTENAQTNATMAYRQDPIRDLEHERTHLINRLAEIEKKILWAKNSDVQRFLQEFPDTRL